MRKYYYFLILFISVFTVQASALSDCLPLNITGNFSICMTGPSHTPTTSQLTVSGGSGAPSAVFPWLSSNTSVATVDNTGLVTSVGFGSTTITYTDSAGTQVSQNVYVSLYPTISGNNSAMCAGGGTLQLNGSLFPHPTTPWQSSNTAIATVDNTGLVTGVSAGTCTITYMNIGGCTTTQTVTIKPLLSPTVSCGTWSNNAMTFSWNAVLGATTYTVVYNINGGAYVFGASGNILTYTVLNVQPTDQVVLYVVPSGAAGTCFSGAFNCQSTPCPDAVTLSGVQNICLGNTTSFTSTVPGGTWSSSNTAIASVNPATGVITGNAAGTATMTYTVLGTGGCPNVVATRTVVVSAPVSAGILSGNQAICYDDENVFFSSTVAGGTWSSSNPSVATINANSGLITPVGTYGTTTMTYTVPGVGGCSNASATRTLTLKEPSLSLVSGSTQTTTCIHTPMIPIVFSGVYTTSASVIDLPAGVTYSYSNGILTISGTPTVAGVYEFQMFASGDCASAMTSFGTITVNECQDLTLISDQSTLNQLVTLNTSISNIVFRIGNSVTNVSFTGLPSGVTGTLNQDTYTLAGTPTVCGVFNYTVTVSGANGISSISGVITVGTTTSMFCDSANSLPNSLAIDWAPIQGATNYEYAYSINGGPTQTGSTLASNYQVPGVQAGQSVLFTLNNAVGVSCFLPVSVTCALLADSDFDTDAFLVYPNPVQDVLYINDLKFTSDISLFNAFGQEVYSVKAVSNSCDIPMYALADGFYWVKITAQEQTKTIKAIKN